MLIAHVQCAVALSGGLLLFFTMPMLLQNSSRASIAKKRGALIATMPVLTLGPAEVDRAHGPHDSCLCLPCNAGLHLIQGIWPRQHMSSVVCR